MNRLAQLGRRFQEGAAALRRRLADDRQFWGDIEIVARLGVVLLWSSIVIAVLAVSAMMSDAAANVLLGVVALQWGGIINPTTGIMVAILVVSTYGARARPSFAASTALALYVISFALANTWRLVVPDYDLAKQLYQLAAFDVLAIQGTLIWYLVRRPDRLRHGDIVAELYWTVYMIAEWGQVAEYLGCKILYDPYTENELAALWGTVVEVSSCGRAFGTWSQHVFPIITTLIIAWPAWRAFQLWHRPPADSR